MCVEVCVYISTLSTLSGEGFHLTAGYVLIAWVTSQVLRFLIVVNVSCCWIFGEREKGNLHPSVQLHRERKHNWQLLKTFDMVLLLKFLYCSRQPDLLIFHLLLLFLYIKTTSAFPKHSLPYFPICAFCSLSHFDILMPLTLLCWKHLFGN